MDYYYINNLKRLAGMPTEEISKVIITNHT